MINQVDYDYYMWLVSQIHVPPNKTYVDLFERMHNLEFVWTVPNDDNRIQDGIDLRVEFLQGTSRRLPKSFLGGASFLEVLVGLSRRAAFTAGGDPELWAWRLIKNLKLNKASDPLVGSKVARVDETIEAVVWRTYDPSGRGGFFPLKNPVEDQTRVEIWYQMNAYVNEMKEI